MSGNTVLNIACQAPCQLNIKFCMYYMYIDPYVYTLSRNVFNRHTKNLMLNIPMHDLLLSTLFTNFNRRTLFIGKYYMMCLENFVSKMISAQEGRHL